MTPPGRPFVDQLDTVTGQFAFIESWIDRAEQLVVRYSPKTGVPTLVIRPALGPDAPLMPCEVVVRGRTSSRPARSDHRRVFEPARG
jgi:hypothetical protein